MARELVPLTLEELARMDGGRIGVAFDQAIQRVSRDCDDRPGEKAVRKVTLQVEFIPIIDVNGLCESVKTTCQVRDTLPTRKSKDYDLGLRKGGMLIVNKSDPTNYQQESLGFEDEE